MHVVAAGVHDAVVFRGEGKACGFLQGQGVHIGANGYHGAFFCALDVAVKAAVCVVVYGDRKIRQHPLNVAGRFHFFAA